MRHRTLVLAIVAPLLAFFPEPSVAATLGEVMVGLGCDTAPQGGRILTPTSTVTALDWPLNILVRVRGVRPGDTLSGERFGPDGKMLWSSGTRYTVASQLNWFCFFIPIPGTPNEERVGTWKFVIRLNDAPAGEVSFSVTPADRTLLASLRAAAERTPNSAVANYRLGVAASMFGEEQLAVAHLKKAADLFRQWVYPHIALGRHYLKRGMKVEARDAFFFARGLLLGEQDPGLVAWLQQVIEEHIRQTE